MNGAETSVSRLLEREVELGALERALVAAREGSGSLVVLEGHAGTGKTSLVESGAKQAAGAGIDVLQARGAEVDQAFSFGVLLQLLESRVANADEAERTELFTGAAGLARPLLEGRPVGSGPEAVFATQHGLYWLIANLAERNPLLLAVDDAHWADAASVRFLASLVHRLDGLALALVVTRRLGETGAGEEGVKAISAAPLAGVLRLRPLSRGAIAELVRGGYDNAADDAFCEACANAVGGNPFYLRELLVELAQREIPARAQHAEHVPQLDLASVTRSVGARLERVGPDATALAEAASVIEGGLPLRFVGAMAEVELHVARGGAQLLADLDILTPDDPVRFVHPVVRRAIYARVGERRRAELHRRAAELLRDEAADPERIAGHLQLGETRGEEWAVGTLLTAAGSAVERGAPVVAAGYLRHALAEGPPTALRPTIVSRLGLAEVAAGDFDSVERVREGAAMTESLTARARNLLLAAEITFYLGRYADADALRLQAAAELGDEDEELAGEIDAYLASEIGMIECSNAKHLRRVAARCERIEARGLPPENRMEQLSLMALASSGAVTGALPAKRVRELASAALSTCADEEIKSAMFQAGLALVLAGDFAEYERAVARSLDAARRRGFVHDYMAGSYSRAATRLRSGDLAGAMADGEAALDIARQGLDGFEPEIRAVLACCLLDRGDLDGARRVLDLPNLERWSGWSELAFFHEARGYIELASGKASEARRAFAEASAVLDPIGAHNPAMCAWRSGMALAEKALGSQDTAEEIVAEEVGLARAFGASRALGIALRAQGLVLGGEPGLSALDEAVTVLEDSAARLEYARALVDRGAAKRRARRPQEARRDLRLGLDCALECDAMGLVERARAELRAAGGRPRRERVSGPAALTPQERRVARMAADGLSNREIAEALFLSRKTIESHLHAAFKKLEISARSELTTVLRDDPTMSGREEIGELSAN